MTVTELYDQLIQSVNAELTAAQMDRSSLKSLHAVSAERISLSGDVAIYQFEILKQAHASLQDAPVTIDTGSEHFDGTVITTSGFSITVGAADIGEHLAACQLLIDLTFIYERLIDLLTYQKEHQDQFNMEMVEILFGMRSNKLNEPLLPVDMYYDSEMGQVMAQHPNPEQHEVLDRMGSWQVLYVWGPPGTGKTTTLSWLAEQCLRRDMSALLVSNTNVAVDRALERLLDSVDGDPVLSHRSRDHDLVRFGITDSERLNEFTADMHLERQYGAVGKQNAAEREKRMRQLMQTTKLAGCTLAKACTDPRLKDRRFDVLLLDEASMAPLPYVAALAALCSKYAVICGDFRQLPPISISQAEVAKRWLTTDVFLESGVVDAEGVVQPRPDLCKLYEQRRMLQPICELVNMPIYHGALRTPKELRKAGTECLGVVDTSFLAPLSDRTANYSHFNLISAMITVGLVLHLFREYPSYSVGVVTPYAAQASIIHALMLQLKMRDEVRVSTVHRFQGEERDIMVFDAVDGAPFWSAGRFLRGTSSADESSRLLNVAVTRARKAFWFVGDLRYLHQKLLPNAFLRNVMQQSWNNGTKQHPNAMLSLLFQEAVGIEIMDVETVLPLMAEQILKSITRHEPVTLYEPLLFVPEIFDAAIRAAKGGCAVSVIVQDGKQCSHAASDAEAAGCALLPLPSAQGRQPYQDQCLIIGNRQIWWGSVTDPRNHSTFLKIDSKPVAAELMFLRKANRSTATAKDTRSYLEGELMRAIGIQCKKHEDVSYLVQHEDGVAVVCRATGCTFRHVINIEDLTDQLDGNLVCPKCMMELHARLAKSGIKLKCLNCSYKGDVKFDKG